MNKMTQKFKSIGIFIFIIILSIGYFLDLQYQWKKFLHAREHANQLEIRIQEIQRKIFDINKYQILLKQLEQKFEQIKTKSLDIDHAQIFLNALKAPNTDQSINSQYASSKLSVIGYIETINTIDKTKNTVTIFLHQVR